LLAVVLVPLAAVGYSKRQQHLYQASAQLLLSHQSLPTLLNNSFDPTASIDPTYLAQTQASLAHVPAVAEATLANLHYTGLTPGQLLGETKVTPRSNADILTVAVTNPNPALAVTLTNAYSKAYIAYRSHVETAAFQQARADLGRRISALEAAKQTNSALYRDLVTKDEQLSTLSDLQSNASYLISAPQSATLVQPRPVRNGILGLVLGIMLGLGLAFLREALDTRIRSVDEIAEALQAPLLGRLPQPSRQLRAANQLAMVEAPNSRDAEPFRVVVSNLDFVNLDKRARTIGITSALAGEGKSTTAANLAVALARTGKSVALVDMDLRRPFLDKFFELEGRPGLADVALGYATLDEALTESHLIVPVTPKPAASTNGGSPGSNGAAQTIGRLQLLGSGPIPPNPGEFIASEAVASVLEQLADRADIVLLDSAPILGIGDTLALSSKVDALLVVTRLNVLHRSTLAELARVLSTSPASVLGFLLAGAESEESYGYGGYGYGYGYDPAPEAAARSSAAVD
jgi:Mrp family chromosome partitioning ATPase/capsular polysaccharide biosynthesis protein